MKCRIFSQLSDYVHHLTSKASDNQPYPEDDIEERIYTTTRRIIECLEEEEKINEEAVGLII